MRRVVFGNWQIKTGALLLALLIWLYVVMQDVYEEEVAVPLEVKDIPQNWVLAGPLPASVTVRVSAQGRRLFRLRPFDLRAVIQVAHRGQGKKGYALTAEDILAPEGVRVMEVIGPKSVDIELDGVMTVELPVQTGRVHLSPAAGYVQVGPVTVTPPRVTVSGPRKFIRPLLTVWTDSIALSEVRHDVSQTVRLSTPEGVGVTVEPSEVEVRASVQELGELWIKGIPVTVVNTPDRNRVRAEPPTISLQVKGGIRRLTALKPSDFTATIDYIAWRNGGGGEIPAALQTPPDVEWMSARPETFTIVGQ